MPSVEERLATIEARVAAAGEARAVRHVELDRRLERMESQMDEVVRATNRHCLKATCIGGSAKLLQGAGAGSGVLLMVYIILQKLGLV